MSEMKRPQEVEMYSGGGLRRSVYLKDEADAYIAALERRAWIAERKLELKLETGRTLAWCGMEAEREIDAEQKGSK